MLQVIHRMSTNLWENLDVPTAWGNSRLQAIWKKKGSKKDPKKYRGISIGSTVCKLLIKLILDRLRPWYELQLSDEQNGFRKDRGTTEGIYTIKRIQQITGSKMSAPLSPFRRPDSSIRPHPSRMAIRIFWFAI